LKQDPRSWHAALLALAVEDHGQEVIEYALLIATIALVVLVALTAFGSLAGTWFQQIAGRVTTAGTG
jgi:Flp pilus assembly pilin Flp